jgi:hypothetical protein
MKNMSLIRFLTANHSVRAMVDGSRKFILPDGPVFPQFGSPAPRLAKPIAPSPAAPKGLSRGAPLLSVTGHPDILDDDYRLPSQEAVASRRGSRPSLREKWDEATSRFFAVTRKS